jgi:hypothetical protein
MILSALSHKKILLAMLIGTVAGFALQVYTLTRLAS